MSKCKYSRMSIDVIIFVCLGCSHRGASFLKNNTSGLVALFSVTRMERQRWLITCRCAGTAVSSELRTPALLDVILQAYMQLNKLQMVWSATDILWTLQDMLGGCGIYTTGISWQQNTWSFSTSMRRCPCGPITSWTGWFRLTARCFCQDHYSQMIDT